MVAVLALAAPRAEAQFFGGYVGFGNTGVYGVGGPVVGAPGRRGTGRPADAGLSGRGRPRARSTGHPTPIDTGRAGAMVLAITGRVTIIDYRYGRRW